MESHLHDSVAALIIIVQQSDVAPLPLLQGVADTGGSSRVVDTAAFLAGVSSLVVCSSASYYGAC